MTGPAVRPDDTSVNLPPLHRILSPDEFRQAQQLSPDALAAKPFPLLPPPAPKDAVAQIASQTPRGAGPTSGTPLSGNAKSASDLFQAAADHPLQAAFTALSASNPALNVAVNGLMAVHLAQYAGQKAAELSMNPTDRSNAEADPNRITGMSALTDAALLTVPIGLGKVAKTLAAGDSPAALAVKQHMGDVADAWNKIFDPASRSPEAGEAAGIIRATTGASAAHYEQAAFKLDEFRRAIDPLPDDQKLAFIDAIEGGRQQANPEFQAPADVIRKTLDDSRDRIRALGTGKLDKFIEDYFPHIWTDPERAADAFKTSGDALTDAKIATGGKAPFEGSKSFLKQREIPTTMEGIKAGLTPVSTNPVDLTLLKLREMERYLVAHQSLNEMKDAGLVKYVASGEQAPDGYARIDDKIATVFGPREGLVKLPSDAIHATNPNSVAGPAGAPIQPSEVSVPGVRIMGQYHAPEPVANIVNNYLSPGLRGNAIYDAYRQFGNGLNQAQLGFSGFHVLGTTINTTVSRMALALQHLADGDPLQAFQKAATAPLGALQSLAQGTVGDLANAKLGTNFQWGLGAKIRGAYMDPESASPEMRALSNFIQEGGGRATQDSFWENSAPKKMVDAWKAGEYGKATAFSVPAALETSMKPVMEHIVPLQKLQVAGEMAQRALANLAPDASLAERRAAAAQVWNSVDNRMGQLVYDNLFWNKTVKDLAMASTRSVGWNLGTIREIGGGFSDLAGMASDALKNGGEGAVRGMTDRAAFAVALPISVGLMGATYQYLRTGQGPAEMKDYFYPKTGEQDADGNAERVQLPSYMKDMVAYSGHPWETVKHKVAPLPSMLFEMLQNQDFYGDEIRNPNDPTVQQVGQEAGYVAKNALPFSITGMAEQAKRGDQSTTTKFGNWFGITPAPRPEVRSAAQNKMADMLKAAPAGSSPEDAAARKTRSDLLAGLRAGGPDVEQHVNDAIENHQLTAPDVVKLLKRAGMSPAQEKFKRLSMAQALEVFQVATPAEKAKFASALADKLARGGVPK